MYATFFCKKCRTVYATFPISTDPGRRHWDSNSGVLYAVHSAFWPTPCCRARLVMSKTRSPLKFDTGVTMSMDCKSMLEKLTGRLNRGKKRQHAVKPAEKAVLHQLLGDGL